jgi:hypothetical protein
LRRKHLRLLLFALLCGCVTVGAWIFWTGGRDLLSRCDRAADLHGIEEYAWLSDHEALFFKVSGSGYRANRSYSLERFDVRNGSSSRLAELTRLFNVSKGWCHTARISPDRKWLLWMADRKYVAATLDGKRHYEWPMLTEFRPHPIDFEDPHMTGPCWLRDSRHWVEYEYLQYRQQFVVHELTVPGARSAIALPPNSDYWFGDSWTGDGPSAKKLFVFSIGGAEVDFSPPTAQIKRHVQLPAQTFGLSLTDSAFDPIHDRLAWMILQMRPPESRMVKILKSIFPFFKTKMQPRHEVWMSGMDGTGRTLIGVFAPESSFNAFNNSTSYVVSTDLRWQPNGKKLSFRHKNALWKLQP